MVNLTFFASERVGGGDGEGEDFEGWILMAGLGERAFRFLFFLVLTGDGEVEVEGD